MPIDKSPPPARSIATAVPGALVTGSAGPWAGAWRRQQRGGVRLASLWLIVLALALAYLFLWPIGVQPEAWQSPADRGHTGPHATNQRLAGLQTWALAPPQAGPEDILAHGGHIYTALRNGDVVRFDSQGRATTVLNTGGRPLGLDISATGQLYIADAFVGLLVADLNAAQPVAKPLLTQIDWPLPDDPIRYADAVAIDAAGNVWLTDASRRFGAKALGGTFEASVLDILEHSCTGRILVIDPVTQRKRVALSGLCFPNGLAFSQSGKHLFVAETGTFRILKIDLARLSVTRSSQGLSNVPSLKNAFDQGAASVLIDNLPGYPDNLSRGEQGRIWVGLTKPRSALVDRSASLPWLRALMLRLPRAAWPVPKAYGHVIAFDETGRIVDDLQDPSGAYPETSGATEHGGKLFVQSLNASSVGWLPYTGPR